MKKVYVISAVVLLILATLLCFHFSVFGTTADGMEQDARKSQKIDGDWNVSESVTDDLGVFLFYDKENNDYTYSIYENKEGFSFGYFFSSGGSAVGIGDGIQGFSYEDSMALVSMNHQSVARIECTSDDPSVKEAVYDMDPDEPFAIVIPSIAEDSTIRIYDQNEKEVSINEISVN